MACDHHDAHGSSSAIHTCCPCEDAQRQAAGVSRREFLGGVGMLGGVVLGGLSWSALAAAGPELPTAPSRKPLVVKPVLSYATPTRQFQRSWRNWGGIQTQQDADAEAARIRGELEKLHSEADFPLTILPLAMGRTIEELAPAQDEIASADVVIYYAAGDVVKIIDFVGKNAKDVIFFCRHQSGPVYLWYEIISPRYLRQHTDTLKVQGHDDRDVVIDRPDELLWRLRALCGLKNTMGSRIIAVGGPGGWATPATPKLAREVWKLDIQTISYKELGELIQAARGDQAAVATAHRRADAYLKIPGTTLETERKFVENAFLLEGIFRRLMQKADCRMLTINGCMNTIMPVAETTACMPISTLNDDGYQIFCESDFVAIPAGTLLSNIAGRPFFMNDPTYPHDGLITLAHCTGTRKMDGKTCEPLRILTHFESDYGAAPKVEFRKGQVVTNVVADFAEKRWVGVRGEVAEVPFLPICRNQVDIRFSCDSLHLAQRMPGFHWMTCYGDYSRELGYALKRTPVQWEFLG